MVKSKVSVCVLAILGLALGANAMEMNQISGYNFGTISGTKLTVDGTKLKYVALSSNDSNNRNTTGWYAGLNISWAASSGKDIAEIGSRVVFEDNAGRWFEINDNTSSEKGSEWSVPGSGLKFEFKNPLWSRSYHNETYWWVYITPEIAEGLYGENYEATLSFSGINGSDKGVSYVFKIVIPTASLTLVDGDGNIVFPKSYDISHASAALNATSFNWDTKEHSVKLGAVTFGEKTLAEGVDYVCEGTWSATGSGMSNCTYEAKLVPAEGSKFEGEKTLTWSVKAPTRNFSSVAKANELIGGSVSVGAVGYRLELESGSDWVYYAASEAPDGSGLAGWYAGFKANVPNEAAYSGFTLAPYMVFSRNDGSYFNAENSSACKAAGIVPGFENALWSDHDFMGDFVWWVRLTVEDVEKAKQAGETVLTRTITAAGLRWKEVHTSLIPDYEDTEGVRERVFTVRANLEDIELYDDKGHKIYPDPLPAVTTDDEVAAAMSDAADSLRANVTTVAAYTAFKAWIADHDLDADSAKHHAFGFFSFATDQSELIENLEKRITPETVEMRAVEMKDATFLLTVGITDLPVGAKAQGEYLRKVFGATGTDDLSAAFSPDAVEYGNPSVNADGSVSYEVHPALAPEAPAPESFFIRSTVVW